MTQQIQYTQSENFLQERQGASRRRPYRNDQVSIQSTLGAEAKRRRQSTICPSFVILQPSPSSYHGTKNYDECENVFSISALCDIPSLHGSYAPCAACERPYQP